MAAGATSEGVRWITPEELRVGIVLLSLVALVGVRAWSEGERPATRGSLRASLPKSGAQLRMVAADRAGTGGRLRLQMRSLTLTRYPAGASDAISRLELFLPVSADACKRWRSQTGHECAQPVRLRKGNLSLTWSRVQAMHFRLRGAAWWSLRPSGSGSAAGLPSGWSLESSSRSITASVGCFGRARFILVTEEAKFHSSCVPGGRTLHLEVQRKSGEDVIAFHGVEELHLNTRAGRVASVVDKGTATAGDEVRTVQGLGEKIGMTAGSGVVTIGANAPPASSATFQADAATAASVEVGDTEVVPTLFSRYEGLWWAFVVGAVLGLFKALWDMYGSESEKSKN